MLRPLLQHHDVAASRTFEAVEMVRWSSLAITSVIYPFKEPIRCVRS
jgi:hypothetical protein